MGRSFLHGFVCTFFGAAIGFVLAVLIGYFLPVTYVAEDTQLYKCPTKIDAATDVYVTVNVTTGSVVYSYAVNTDTGVQYKSKSARRTYSVEGAYEPTLREYDAIFAHWGFYLIAVNDPCNMYYEFLVPEGSVRYGS